MNITFDMSQLNNPNLTPSNVYVTFMGNAAQMLYGFLSPSENITFYGNNVTVDGVSYGTSKAYSLEDIAMNGLIVYSATSMVGIISYGSAAGIELLPTGTQPAFLSSATPRCSLFEFSYNGTTGGADITNITQYGGSIQLAFLSQGAIQNQVENTLDTTSMFDALAAASGFSGSTSTSAVFLDSKGLYVRVIGANAFPIGDEPNPYPTFNAYLQSLYTTYDSNSIVSELTNLAPGASPGGEGATGYPSTQNATNVTPNTDYNLDYHFTAVITQVTTPDPDKGNPNGTYSVELSGYVNATVAGNFPNDIQSYKYDGLSVSLAADDLNGTLYMTNFIYLASPTGAGTSVTYTGWDDFVHDFIIAGSPPQGIQLQVTGDFAEGMTCGFFGSTTPSTSSPGTNLGALTSYEWWQNPLLAYEPAQPANSYYSTYGNVVYTNSEVTNNGTTYPHGGIYSSPYDDRFGLNLISADADTDEMRITLLADGDLQPN